MRATKLKEKYPEIWDNVYDSMIVDLCDCMAGADIQQFKEGNKDSRIVRLAHNAAFLACYEHHKTLKSLVSIKKIA